MRIAVDLDGTLTTGDHSFINYLAMTPDFDAIDKINKLADAGHEIIIFTARPHLDYVQVKKWLHRHAVKFAHVECGKLKADMYVDNNSRKICDL